MLILGIRWGVDDGDKFAANIIIVAFHTRINEINDFQNLVQ